MKKLLAIVLVVVAMMGLTACGGKKTESNAFKNAQVGSVVEFGKYENAPMEWQVLAKEDGKVLLLAKGHVGSMAFNEEKGETSWETSTLKAWLNDEFYNKAFGKSEKKLIDASNNVFLLSDDEVKTYLPDEATRSLTVDGKTYRWWLRTSHVNSKYTLLVTQDGTVGFVPANKANGNNGINVVRPAIWVNM